VLFGISEFDYRSIPEPDATIVQRSGLLQSPANPALEKNMPQLSLARLCLLVVAVCAVFLVRLGSAQLWDRDEPRNSQASVEMLDRGDWTVPTFNGQLRTHKPILLYWGQMASYLSFGKSEFSARFPSAIASILAALAIAVLASRLSGSSHGINATGFWSALVFATCLMTVMAGRAATPDALLIATSTLGIAILVIGTIAPAAPYSSGYVGPTRWLFAAAAYVCFGFAVLAKGPVGLILPMAVVHAWWMISKKLQTSHQQESGGVIRRVAVTVWRCFNPMQALRAILALRTVPGVLLVMLVAAPWYVAVDLETQGAFTRGFFWEHNVGRAVHAMEGHDGGVLFYPIAFLVGTFPWSLWLIPIAMWASKSYFENVVQRQLILLGLIWIGVYLSAFTVASTKLPSYITPCYAGAALIIGSYWKQFESCWQMPSARLRWIANGFATTVGLAIAVTVVFVSRSEGMPSVAGASICGAAIAIAGMISLYLDWIARPQWIPTAWLCAAVLFQVSLFGFGAAQASHYRSDLDLVRSIQQQRPSRHWIGVGTVEPSWVYYLGSPIVELSSRDPSISSWQRAEDYLTHTPSANVVIVAEELLRIDENRSQYPNLSRLVELGRTKRFLKPGEFAVFALPSPGLPLKVAKPNAGALKR
jgi:4-amino-4-deoxy-L-arabinose transferase-like glycosyltransferase